VKAFFKVVALCLALLWVPMTSHCDLEHLPGMGFIACCELPQSGPHQDDDCETDVCATVESGHYKTEERAVTAPAPCLIALLVSPLLAASSSEEFSALPIPPSIREDLPPRWAFILRQASSPRAPSSAV
jgi:hypothetical protein